MNRYAIATYPQAERRLIGGLYDVGQIAPSVISQLYLAVRQGLVRVTTDSWPIRGLGPEQPQRTLFVTTKRPNEGNPL